MASTPTDSSTTGIDRKLVLLVLLFSMLATGCSLLLAKDLFTGAVAMGIIVVLGTLMLRPTWATWMFLFISYANAPAVAVKFHDVPAAVAGSSILLLVIPTFYFVVIRRQRFYFDQVVPWLLGYSFVQAISAAVSEDRVNSFEILTVFLVEGLLLYLLTINAIRFRSAVWALLAAGFFMGSLGIIQTVTGQYWRDFKGFALVSEPELNAWGDISGGRWPAGPIGDKNYYAQFMLMLFPLSMTQAFNQKSKMLRLAGWISGAVILAGVGLTGSRGAAVGFVAMMGVMIMFRYVSFKQASVIGIGAFCLLLLMPATRERIVSIVSVVDVVRGEDIRKADPAMKGRLTEMVAAALVFIEHPLTGVGPGNFPKYFLEKADLLGFTMHAVERHAHNIYLEIAAESGIPGITCFLAILFLIVRKLYVAHRVAPTKELRDLSVACLATMVIMMTTSMFLSLAYARYYFLVFGVCSALGRIVIEESRAHSETTLREGAQA